MTVVEAYFLNEGEHYKLNKHSVEGGQLSLSVGTVEKGERVHGCSKDGSHHTHVECYTLHTPYQLSPVHWHILILLDLILL